MEKFYVLEDYIFADGRTDKQYFPYESEMEAMSAIHDHYNSITDVFDEQGCKYRGALSLSSVRAASMGSHCRTWIKTDRGDYIEIYVVEM